MQPDNQPTNNPAPITPPQPQPPNPAPSIPPQPANSLVGLTGSQIQQQVVPLPKGVYALTILGVIAFAISFFDTSQNNLLYTIDMLLILVVTIGLFFRLELARKLLFYLSILTIILSAIVIIGFVLLQNRVKHIKLQSDAAFAKLEGQSLTATQRQQLDAMKSEIENNEKRFGKSLPLVYTKYAATMVLYSGVAIYLTRPKVKEVFHKDLK